MAGRDHFHILDQLQTKYQSKTLSNPKTNPRIRVHLLCTSESIIAKYSYLMPHNIRSKKMNALIVIGMEYNNVSLAFKVVSDDFY